MLIVNPSPGKAEIAAIQPATIDTKDTAPSEKPQTSTKQSSCQSQWPVGTTHIVGDSMLGSIEESRLGPKRKVHSFPSATIKDMSPFSGRN